MSNESPTTFAPVPPPRASAERSPGRAWPLRLGLLALLALGGMGCADKNVWVYVDNTDREPMVVSVDGKDEATIPPGKFQIVKIPPGKKRLRVRRGRDVVFDATKELQPGSLLVGRRYFLNPGNRNRYVVVTVKYGSSPFEGWFKKDHSGEDQQAQMRAAYKELAAEVKLLPAEPWFEIPESVGVLTRAPKFVTTRGFTERRKYLTRIDPEDYAVLLRAQRNRNPSERDVEELLDVVDRAEESVAP